MEAKEYINQNRELLLYFSHFSLEDISELKVVEYSPKTTIIDYNNSNNNIYIIVKGICYVYKKILNNKPFCIYKIANSDIIGFNNINSIEEKNEEYKVISTTKIIAIKIPKKDYLKYKEKYSTFHDNIINAKIHRLNTALTIQLECSMYNSTINVVSYLIYSYQLFLKMFDDSYTGQVTINETRATINKFTGISIRSINNTIEYLKNLNYITIKRGKINIDKKQYLDLVSYKLDNI